MYTFILPNAIYNSCVIKFWFKIIVYLGLIMIIYIKQ